MKWFCKHCKKIHEENDLCPKFKEQLKHHPEILSEVADFVTVAGEEVLITSQVLDNMAQVVNKVIGTNLSYEGTQQLARDIRVFKRLSEEPFKRSGVFSTPEAAKAYFENLLKMQHKPGALQSFESKLTGYAQEVDWIREKQGEISSLWEKSTLLENNAAGIDGITVNRFTGSEIRRTTIKASKNPVTANSTGINDVKEAIRKGTATDKDIIFAPQGTGAAAKDAGLSNPVVEKNTAEQIRKSNARLENKILSGQATTKPTTQQIVNKVKQGAIVGAAISITISSITNYCKYKNGEISKEEAFSLVGEDTLKGSFVGAALGGITIFLPGGIIGFVGGMAIGVYFDRTCTNVLDEIFGKGGYGAILDASGYVYGMTLNLEDSYIRFNKNHLEVKSNLAKADVIQQEIDINFDTFEQMKRGYKMKKQSLKMDKGAFAGKQEDYDLIKKALHELTSKSQEQFEEMKKETWFNRLFDMLSFSNKKEIRVAEKITTIAQAQQIFIEMLMRLSVDDKHISQMIVQSQKNIQTLSKQNKYLFNTVNRLNTVCGIKPDMDVMKLSNDAKSVLSACLFKISGMNDVSEAQKVYANAVFEYLGKESQMDNPFAVVGEFDEDARRRMLSCCLEFFFLKDCSEDSYTDADYKKAIYAFDLGQKTIDDIKTQIRYKFKLRGLEGLCSRFKNNSFGDIDETFFTEFDNDIEEDEINAEQNDTSDNQSENETKAIKHSFVELERIIKNKIDPDATKEKPFFEKAWSHIPLAKSGEKPLGKELDEKDKDEFLLKNFSHVERKTVISITKGNDYYLVFTTYALHMYSFSHEKEYCIPYKDIAEEYIKLDVSSKHKKFVFEKNYGERIEIVDDKIDLKELMNLLLEIKQKNDFASTDKVFDFDSINYNVIVGYYHIISCVLMDNSLSLAELFRRIFADNNHNWLVDYWEEIAKEESDPKAVINQWVNSLPYPYEEALSRKLVRDICTVFQYTKQSNELTAKQQKFFPDILRWTKESDTARTIENEIIGSHLQKDFMDGKEEAGEEFAKKIRDYTIEEAKTAGYKTVGASVAKNLTVTGLSFLLGPLGLLARTIVFVLDIGIPVLIIKDFLNKKDIKILQLRKDIYEEVISSYKQALEVWNGLPEAQKQKYWFQQSYNMAIANLETQLKELNAKLG